MRILSGYGKCKEASSVCQGIETYQKAFNNCSPFDLVLLDLGLLDGSGAQVLSHIRKTEEENEVVSDKKTKVIIISGSFFDESSELKNIDYDAFILKPFKKNKLLETINNLMNIPLEV